jgi:hypothetical protein
VQLDRRQRAQVAIMKPVARALLGSTAVRRHFRPATARS